jgi:hypothetical protein
MGPERNRWLKYRLGYECKETKKGWYIDGHEHPDVIVERKTFLKKPSSYERYVACINALNAFTLLV